MSGWSSKRRLRRIPWKESLQVRVRLLPLLLRGHRKSNKEKISRLRTGTKTPIIAHFMAVRGPFSVSRAPAPGSLRQSAAYNIREPIRAERPSFLRLLKIPKSSSIEAAAKEGDLARVQRWARAVQEAKFHY